jgi:hypothetical protein
MPDLAGLSKDLHWARVDEVRLHKRIPVDARHNAKVDHGAVAARLNRQSGLSRLVAWLRVHRPAEDESRAAMSPWEPPGMTVRAVGQSRRDGCLEFGRGSR